MCDAVIQPGHFIHNISYIALFFVAGTFGYTNINVTIHDILRMTLLNKIFDKAYEKTKGLT